MTERHRLKKTVLFVDEDDRPVLLMERNTEAEVIKRCGNSTVTVKLHTGDEETFNASWFLRNFEPVIA